MSFVTEVRPNRALTVVEAARRVGINERSVVPHVPPTAATELPTHRDVLLQALLHLPRVADEDGSVAVDFARREIERMRALRAAELAPVRALAEPPACVVPLDQV